jgi:preprotein translocase subunit SecY
VNLLEALGQAIRIPELRRKLLFTLGLLGAFRILAAIAIPGTNARALDALFSGNTLLGLLNLFSGGGLQRFTLVALGLNPYINATIIMQLMTVVSVRLKELSKEGEIGRKKITRYTRWLTVPLAMLQAFGYLALFQQPVGNLGAIIQNPTAATEISIILTLTAGTIIAMWLGELITEYGVGNGVSLIIFVGIVLRYPTYVSQTVQLGQREGLNVGGLVLFLIIALFTIVSIIFMYQGQRRIPVQQARRVVGRKMFAGRSSYIPLRLNNAGVISIIFAISILLLPQQALSWFAHSGTNATYFHLGPVEIPSNGTSVSLFLQTYFSPNTFLYNLAYFLLVVVFTFFYSSVVVNVRDIADNLKKSGSFIPGIRPGQPTVEYIQKILLRITTVAAVYLGLLAVLPSTLQRGLGVTTFYLGSTSLLIVVGVALDTMTQIEARLAMRDYKGFIKR